MRQIRVATLRRDCRYVHGIRAGVKNARVHDLRHTRITELAPTLPLQVLARLTGHRDPAMLMRYYNPTAADAAVAGRAIAAYFERAAGATADHTKSRGNTSKRRQG